MVSSPNRLATDRSSKRPHDNDDSQSARRIKPILVAHEPFTIVNLTDGETVHQRCLLVAGKCGTFGGSLPGAVLVSVEESSLHESLPKGSPALPWPVDTAGNWTSMVMLEPGQNKLKFQLHRLSVVGEIELTVNYVPLLQIAPLHLAILVASDSPLLIDCPPSRYGLAFASNTSLAAAVAKFRMTAYMWQAKVAEDMRSHGFGRRTFRLEEEWTRDATSIYVQGMNSTARVHIVRSDLTVAAIRSETNNQSYMESSGDNLFLRETFKTALKKLGGPFSSDNNPAVAGMILDTHFDFPRNQILGHISTYTHDPKGLSLGIFGSHLAHSWPRFMEEAPHCLTDRTPTDDTVAHGHGEFMQSHNYSMGEVCSLSQGAFLRNVGRALGAPERFLVTGQTMQWANCFVAGATPYSDRSRILIDHALQLSTALQLRLPGDSPLSEDHKSAKIEISVEFDEEHDDEELLKLQISCSAGLLLVIYFDKDGSEMRRMDLRDTGNPSREPCRLFELRVPSGDISAPEIPDKIFILASNGKSREFHVSSLLNNKIKTFIFIPNGDLKLGKQSVRSDSVPEGFSHFSTAGHGADADHVTWAMLLKKRGANSGQLVRACNIDIRVGCTMDGAVVNYEDGSKAHCGPTYNSQGNVHHFGGHASQDIDLPSDAKIVKVEIFRHCWGIQGIRMTLDSGEQWGELNDNKYGSEDEDREHENNEDGDDENEDVKNEDGPIHVLEPAANERIIGFFGVSERSSGYTEEFGILTAPVDRELPDAVYDMAEFQAPRRPH